MTLVVVDRVSRSYRLGEQWVNALTDVSLVIEEGVFLAIAGPSGSGKSTLLNLIGCIDVPTSGRIRIDGEDTSGRTPDQLAALRSRSIGFVFQSFNLLPVLSAAENVEYPLLRFAELDQRARRERVAKYLEIVRLEKFGHHRPSELSGGQRQRVAIARALATEPRLVLADEPTANLDSKTGRDILALMREINERSGTTFVFSTHDSKIIAMANRLVRIEDGQIRHLGKRAGQDAHWTLVRDRRDRTKHADSIE